jgi:hypothetical protein
MKCSATFYHNEASRKLAAATTAYEAWKKSDHQGDWMDAAENDANVDRDYLDRHSSAIQAGCESFEIYCPRHSAL